MSGIGNFILQSFLEKYFGVTTRLVQERKTNPELNHLPVNDKEFKSVSKSLATLSSTITSHTIQSLIIWRDKLIFHINSNGQPKKTKKLKRLKTITEKTLVKMMSDKTLTPTIYFKESMKTMIDDINNERFFVKYLFISTLSKVVASVTNLEPNTVLQLIEICHSTLLELEEERGFFKNDLTKIKNFQVVAKLCKKIIKKLNFHTAEVFYENILQNLKNEPIKGFILLEFCHFDLTSSNGINLAIKVIHQLFNFFENKNYNTNQNFYMALNGLFNNLCLNNEISKIQNKQFFKIIESFFNFVSKSIKKSSHEKPLKLQLLVSTFGCYVFLKSNNDNDNKNQMKNNNEENIKKLQLNSQEIQTISEISKKLLKSKGKKGQYEQVFRTIKQLLSYILIKNTDISKETKLQIIQNFLDLILYRNKKKRNFSSLSAKSIYLLSEISIILSKWDLNYTINKFILQFLIPEKGDLPDQHSTFVGIQLFLSICKKHFKKKEYDFLKYLNNSNNNNNEKNIKNPNKQKTQTTILETKKIL